MKHSSNFQVCGHDSLFFFKTDLIFCDTHKQTVVRTKSRHEWTDKFVKFAQKWKMLIHLLNVVSVVMGIWLVASYGVFLNFILNQVKYNDHLPDSVSESSSVSENFGNYSLITVVVSCVTMICFYISAIIFNVVLEYERKPEGR